MIELIRHLSRTAHDPEDLKQELSIIAWKHKRRGDSPPEIRQRMKWYAMDYYKAASRRRTKFTSLEMVSDTALDRLPKSLREAFEEIALSIRLESRDILILLAQGYTVREIAGRLGISRSNAGRIAQKTKKNLNRE